MVFTALKNKLANAKKVAQAIFDVAPTQAQWTGRTHRDTYNAVLGWLVQVKASGLTCETLEFYFDELAEEARSFRRAEQANELLDSVLASRNRGRF
jgi:hypothetical protein